MTLRTLLWTTTLGIALSGCGETLNAGASQPHGPLPVDERNPLILVNDNVWENWQGEYALMLSNAGGPKLAGIIVNTSYPWPDLEANVDGWRGLVMAARASSLEAPDPITSVGEQLVRPESGQIEDTLPNRSEGALFIVHESQRLSLPYRPVVVATGGRLTDVADAYLIDPTVADRIVVASSLGKLSETGAAMANPNGEMDPWADVIVTSRLRYVQVSAFYDQLTDLPASRIGDVPNHTFGAWIGNKAGGIWELSEAADQVVIAAIGIPDFAATVQKASVSTNGTLRQGPDLLNDPDGPVWLVSEVRGEAATAAFWKLLTRM